MSRTVIIPIVVLMIVFSFLLHAYWQSKRKVRRLNREYPSISYDRKLNLTIREIFNPESLRDAPNHAFVTFSNNEKATIETTNELNIDTLSLDDLLEIGDSIVKATNSNCILVYKATDADSIFEEPFQFILWEFKNIR